MNLLISCVGKRGGYVADFFRPHLGPGDRIIGTANTEWTPGFQACDAGYVLPDVDDDSYVPAVLDLCERQQIDALICVEDFDLEKLAPVRNAFVDLGVLPLFPQPDVVDLAIDKYRMSEFLTGHGIATPRTALSLVEASGYRYPQYVKPRRGSGSQGVFLAGDEAERDVFFRRSPAMVIQEAVPGQEINIQLCCDLDAKPVGLCLLTKRGMRHGETDQAETFREPGIIEFGLRLAELLGASGPLDIDVIRDGDALVVLDVNTRFGGGYPVAHLAGADFPRLLLDLVEHGKVSEPSFSFTPGVVMMKGLRIIGGPAEQFFRSELKTRRAQGQGGVDGVWNG